MYRVLSLIVNLLCVSIAFAAPLRGPLDNVANIDADFTAHRTSSYNPTGENRDWWWTKPGQTQTLLDVEGPGMIQHIWMTIGSVEARYGSRLVLRMYWDGNDFPSVEVPVGDFFGQGFGYQNPFYNALFEVSAEGRARNCFIPMPFEKHARVTLTNESEDNTCRVFYYVDYRKYNRLPQGLGRFHAQYRQQFPCAGGNFVVVSATGEGRYLGCHLSCHNTRRGWMGEGDDMIYIDGADFPTLYGTGTEDYFSDAWGFRPFHQPYHGLSVHLGDRFNNSVFTAYRYHVQDAVPFKKSVLATIEHGSQNDRSDDWATVGFWYQKEAVSVAGTLPPVQERLLAYPEVFEITGPVKWEGEELIGKLIFAGGEANAQTLANHGLPEVGQMLFENHDYLGWWSMMLHFEKLTYLNVRMKLTDAPDYGIWQLYEDSMPVGQPIDLYAPKVRQEEWVDFGRIRCFPGEKQLEFRCQGRNVRSSGYFLGLDALELR